MMHTYTDAPRHSFENSLTRRRTSTSRITVYQTAENGWSLVKSEGTVARGAVLLSGYWVDERPDFREPLIRGAIDEPAWTVDDAIALGIVLVVETK